MCPTLPLPPHTLKIHPLICVESFVDADTVMNFTRVLFLQQFRGKSSKIFIQNLKLHYNHYLSTINHYITIIRLKRGKAKKNKLKYERSHGVHPLLHSQKLHLSTTRKTNNSKRKQNSTAVLNSKLGPRWPQIPIFLVCFFIWIYLCVSVDIAVFCLNTCCEWRKWWTGGLQVW